MEGHILVYISSMKRLINYHLQSWKEDKRRKPLLLRGARQVGKTFAVRQLGKTFESVVEVDYLIDYQTKVLPVEVKSGHGTTLRSMHQFLLDHPQTPFGVRFWAEQESKMEKLDSLPLYAAVLFAHSDQEQALKKLLI